MKPLAAIALICSAVSLVHEARAATFAVNSTQDFVDTSPGDGVCLSQPGRCTLRAAVQEANALPGADTITVPAGPYNLTIPGRHEDAAASGDLDITDDVTITGAGPSTRLAGYSADRVFDVHEAAHLTLSGATITGGLTSLGEDGGGMLNAGSITLTNVTFLRNRAGRGGWGGGLVNTDTGSATLQFVSFSRNAAGDASDLDGDGDGYGGGYGGGMQNDGTVDLTDVTFSNNRAGNGGGRGWSVTEPGSGGGMANTGTATLTRVTFTKNRAGNGRYDSDGGGGGGMLNLYYYDNNGSHCGTAVLRMVTFRSNLAGNGSSGPNTGGDGGSGGGLADDCGGDLADVRFTRNRAGRAGNGGKGDDGFSQHGGGEGGFGGGFAGSGTLTNVTFDGNQAGKAGAPGGTGGSGGGFAGGGTLTNVTVVSNRAGNGAGLFAWGGSGGGVSGYGTLTNVTLASNHAGKGAHTGGAGEGDDLDFRGNLTNTIAGSSASNCSSSSHITSLGHNLDRGASCGFAASGDLTNVDPGVRGLASNGGFTPTVALQPLSPAIDAGDDTACPATDQRGVIRPQGAACDMGAYESP